MEDLQFCIHSNNVVNWVNDTGTLQPPPLPMSRQNLVDIAKGCYSKVKVLIPAFNINLVKDNNSRQIKGDSSFINSKLTT